MPTRKVRSSSLYGYPGSNINQVPVPIVQNRAPAASDQAEIGTLWVDSTANTAYILTSIGAAGATWTTSPSGGTSATSFTVNPGNLTVTAGDIIVSVGDVTAAGIGTFGSLSTGNATIGGTLGVTGVATFGDDVTINADLILNGDFDITSVDSISITSTNNAAGAITLLVNGGAAETILIQSAQGTGADSIDIESVAGGITLTAALASDDAINLVSSAGGLDINAALQINIDSSEAAVDAIRIFASNAAGGIDVDYGTGGMVVTGANGAFSLATGTGAINLGADAAAHAITMGNNTGATSVSIQAGTAGAGAINIGTTANAVPITIGNGTGASSVALLSGTGGVALSSAGTGDITLTSADTVLIDGAGVIELNSSAGDINIANTAGGDINIGTSADARIVTIGNVTGATQVVLNSGTAGVAINTTGAGDFVVTSADTVLIDSAGVLELNSSGGVIGIGNDAVAQNINIGTGAAARVITMGNSSGASSVVIDVGTGALNVGTTATAHATAVGSTTAGSTLVLNTPTGVNTVAANGLSVTTAGRGLSLPGGVLVLAGAGSPDTVVTAPVGSMFLRTDPAGAASRVYVNTDGATAWTNLTAAA